MKTKIENKVEPKLIRFLRLFKPAFTYLFFLYVASLLAFGWILYLEKMFNTVPLLYLFLTLFFAGYVFLGYALFNIKMNNTSMILGSVILMVIPAFEQRMLFYKLSFILFGFGLVQEIIKIAFKIDIVEWTIDKLAKEMYENREKKK